ncbi:MAG: hypothetical protein QGH83_13140 [Candidatus Pacebacteria bacterium]|jgi:hypothetical protein|nr:hypothetical protein [Candidatus Paceibacterota bacterium]|tara:strand:+ start:579 stop:848 length:270 start_codon:yes stop_codon:yes gene_type:complete
MTNYDMDEIERQRDRERKSRGIQPEPQAAITLEISDDVVLKLSLLAHERGITLNKMIHIALKKGLSSVDNTYKTTNPQLLNEKRNKNIS